MLAENCDLVADKDYFTVKEKKMTNNVRTYSFIVRKPVDKQPTNRKGAAKQFEKTVLERVAVVAESYREAVRQLPLQSLFSVVR